MLNRDFVNSTQSQPQQQHKDQYSSAGHKLWGSPVRKSNIPISTAHANANANTGVGVGVRPMAR